MTVTFGPQLIGETEKTLNALLRGYLAGTDLTEPQWVTLRLTAALDGSVTDAAQLAAAVSDRAHFTDAQELVRGLTDRGLIDGARLTTEGRQLIDDVQQRIADGAGRIWADLPDDEVAAATRVLNRVLTRARAILE